MARKQSKTVETAKPESMEMIARLLALLVIRGVEKDEACAQLSGVGFDNKAIADMLGMTESAVRGVHFRRSKAKAT